MKWKRYRRGIWELRGGGRLKAILQRAECPTITGKHIWFWMLLRGDPNARGWRLTLAEAKAEVERQFQ